MTNNQASIQLSRRAVLRLLGLGAGTALLAACQPTAPAPAPTTAPAKPGEAKPAAATQPAAAAKPDVKPAEAAKPAGQPRSGGTLKIGVLGDPPNIDGHWIQGTIHTYHVWDRPVEYDPNLNPLPLLAESWDVNQNWTQVKLNLRKGVQWHSGRDFTSEDMVWNYSRIKTDPKVNGGGHLSLIAPLKTMETPDKSTLILKADEPWPNVFDMLSLINMIDPENMKEPDGKPKAVGTQPAGTGPFTFGEYVQGDHMTFKKNDKYWMSGKPYLDGLEYKIFSDTQAMVTQLEAGALDAAIDPTYRDTARLQKDGKLQVLFNEYTGARTLILLQSKPDAGPTSNKQFRQAIQYAVDRQRIVDTVYLGLSTVGNLPFAPTNPAYNPEKDKHYTFDLDKAKSLVAASGVSNPEIDVTYSAVAADYAQIGQILQQDLAKIGVKINLKPLEPAAASTALFTSSFPGMYIGRSIFGQLHPGFMQGNPNFSSVVNWAGFKSDKLVELTNTMVHEVDPAKQKQASDAWSDYVLDESWAVVICTQKQRVVSHPKVKGLRWNLDEMFQANDAWLEA
jgi:peptide/nickel transport system substrate-binding protein